MRCQVKVINMGASNGNYYEMNNVGSAKLVALWHLRKFNGVAIIKISGKGRKFFVLGPDNRLCEVGEKAGQEHINLIEENVDLRVFEKEVEYVEKFYGVPTEPSSILFVVEGSGKKPSLWSRIIKTVKAWF